MIFTGITYKTVGEPVASEKLDTMHILCAVQSYANLSNKILGSGVHAYVERPVKDYYNAVDGKDELVASGKTFDQEISILE